MKNRCRLCLHESYKTFSVEEKMFGLSETFDYFICDNCNSLSLSRIPANMSHYYPENYYSFAQTKNKGLKNWISKIKSASDLGEYSFLGKITSLIIGRNSNLHAIGLCKPNKERSKILDIGCGEGFLLDKLSEQNFKNISGIDPYISKDIHKGDFQIQKKSIENLLKDHHKYDIIILSHVFEHFENPKESLENIFKLLNKDGFLILRTPISSSYAFTKYGKNWFQIDAPRHVLVPSYNGLIDACDSIGFELKFNFFDSDPKQFIISNNYERGEPMVSQKLDFVRTKLYPKAIYYSFLSHMLNLKKLGDQATLIFKKN